MVATAIDYYSVENLLETVEKVSHKKLPINQLKILSFHDLGRIIFRTTFAYKSRINDAVLLFYLWVWAQLWGSLVVGVFWDIKFSQVFCKFSDGFFGF
jgi:hypothetical protein